MEACDRNVAVEFSFREFLHETVWQKQMPCRRAAPEMRPVSLAPQVRRLVARHSLRAARSIGHRAKMKPCSIVIERTFNCARDGEKTLQPRVHRTYHTY